MATSPMPSQPPEWQLWAYRIKIELQENINAFDSLLKDFQGKMALIDDGLNIKFDTMNADLQMKGSDIHKMIADVSRLREDVDQSRTSLAEQEQKVQVIGEGLAAEQALSAKRYKEQITINKNIREDMQRAANHLTDLQMQAKQDSDRKENDIAILKAENDAIWPQLEALKATLMLLTNEQEEPDSQPGDSSHPSRGSSTNNRC